MLNIQKYVTSTLVLYLDNIARYERGIGSLAVLDGTQIV